MSAADAALIEAFALADAPCPLLTEADTALSGFVRKLTRSPSAMAESDVTALRALGWSDRAIYDATSIAGFFAFVNRVVSGLGVPLEANWREFLQP